MNMSASAGVRGGAKGVAMDGGMTVTTVMIAGITMAAITGGSTDFPFFPVLELVSGAAV